jgi:predicted dehydrogenase
MWRRVAATGVKHMTAFNYRFYPAIRLAKEMIDGGELGEIYHFRGRYHQEWIMDPEFPKVWRLDKEVAGSGALGDLGAHVIDQSRYLAGEPAAVNGVLRTFIEERPGGIVDVDDAFEATVEFESVVVPVAPRPPPLASASSVAEVAVSWLRPTVDRTSVTSAFPSWMPPPNAFA